MRDGARSQLCSCSYTAAQETATALTLYDVCCGSTERLQSKIGAWLCQVLYIHVVRDNSQPDIPMQGNGLHKERTPARLHLDAAGAVRVESVDPTGPILQTLVHLNSLTQCNSMTSFNGTDAHEPYRSHT